MVVVGVVYNNIRQCRFGSRGIMTGTVVVGVVYNNIRQCRFGTSSNACVCKQMLYMGCERG